MKMIKIKKKILIKKKIKAKLNSINLAVEIPRKKQAYLILKEHHLSMIICIFCITN